MKPKVILILHVVGQLLAQTAVLEVIPDQYKPLASALVAVVGVVIGVLDQSVAKAGGLFKK